MEFLNQLGSVTEQRWKARNYDDDHFAEIAFQTLQELPPSEHVTYEQIIEWALRAQKMPAQNDFPFGQPPIVLFRSSHFYIEALFWLEGTTSIHQHAFSGAFHVLGGSSIHSNFDFQLKERINARFLIGDIVRKHTEFLSRGDTRRIQPGSQFIHSLFHLDEPSVTIVIRTTANIEFQPQYTYLIPSIAIDPFVEDLTLKRRLQLLTVVQKANHLDLFRLTSELLSNSDIETAFRILEHCYASWDEKEFMKLFEKTRSQHGSVIDYFSPVLEKISRASYLVERRKSTQNPDHRFFLPYFWISRTARISFDSFARDTTKNHATRSFSGCGNCRV